MALKFYTALIFLVQALPTKASPYFLHPYHNRCTQIWGSMADLGAEIVQSGVENSQHAYVSRLAITQNRGPRNRIPVYRFEIAKDLPKQNLYGHGDRFILQFGIEPVIHPHSILHALVNLSSAGWRLPTLSDVDLLFESEIFRGYLTKFPYRGAMHYLIWNVAPEVPSYRPSTQGRFIKVTLAVADRNTNTARYLVDFVPINTEPLRWEVRYHVPIDYADSKLEEISMQIIRTQGAGVFFLFSDAYDQSPIGLF